MTLVLHDWGGPIGLGAAIEQPDRVRAVVAMNTWAWELPTLAFPRDIPLTERDPSAAAIARIQERLPALGRPLLLVWGMRDRVFQPVFVEQWRELCPGARVVELADAGHYLVEDRPDGVADAIHEFVTSL